MGEAERKLPLHGETLNTYHLECINVLSAILKWQSVFSFGK